MRGQATSRALPRILPRPSGSETLRPRTTTWALQGRRQEARVAFERAIQLDPGYANAHRALGITLYREGPLQDAAHAYERAIQLAPDDVSAHHNFGVLRQAQGKLDEAIAHYRNALRFDSRHPDSHHGLALAFRAQGKAAESVQHYREALQAVPNWPDVLIDLAWLLATAADPSVRNPQEAVQVAERAVRSAPLSGRRSTHPPSRSRRRSALRRPPSVPGVRSISQSPRATMKPPVRFASASASTRGALIIVRRLNLSSVRPPCLSPHIDAALAAASRPASEAVHGETPVHRLSPEIAAEVLRNRPKCPESLGKAAGGPKSPEASGTPGLPSLRT